MPYQLQLRLSKNRKYQCGATLISSKYAISAAHCFFDHKTGKGWLHHFSELTVVAGSYMRNSYGYCQTSQIRNVSTSFNGYNFDRNNDVDIVIIELERPFDLIKDIVQPACLPSEAIKSGSNCHVSGWNPTGHENLKGSF